jgi:hypothetical protein
VATNLTYSHTAPQTPPIEAPAIRISTLLLIGLQHQGATAISTTATKNRPVSAAKDDHPFAVWSVSGLRDGFCEDPMLILVSTYLNEVCAKGTGVYYIRWPRPARPASSLTLPMIVIGHAVGETSCAHPEPTNALECP